MFRDDCIFEMRERSARHRRRARAIYNQSILFHDQSWVDPNHLAAKRNIRFGSKWRHRNGGLQRHHRIGAKCVALYRLTIGIKGNRDQAVAGANHHLPGWRNQSARHAKAN